jgi:hypothetical protein
MKTLILSISSPMLTSPSSQRVFDYASLDSETSQFVQQQTGQIRVLMKRTARGIVEIGQKLIEVKEKLGHGRFGDWLQAEFGWSWDTAGRFINVAIRFGDFPQIAEFAPSALYVLAAPSVPGAARTEAITRAQAGEHITYTTAEEIKRKHLLLSPKVKRKTKVQPGAEARLGPELVVPSQLETQAQLAIQPQLELATQTVTIPAQSESQQRATEPSSPKQEIIAIRPRAAVQELILLEEMEKTSRLTLARTSTSISIQPGSWWQLEKQHLLYCGEPKSARFQERLPKEVALSLTFPPSLTAWPDSLPPQVKSAVCLFTPYKDQDRVLLQEMVERALLLYSESDDAVVFSFLPEPKLLLLAHQLECSCFVAEPNARKCEATIATWKGAGMKVEQISELKF